MNKHRFFEDVVQNATFDVADGDKISLSGADYKSLVKRVFDDTVESLREGKSVDSSAGGCNPPSFESVGASPALPTSSLIEKIKALKPQRHDALPRDWANYGYGQAIDDVLKLIRKDASESLMAYSSNSVYCTICGVVSGLNPNTNCIHYLMAVDDA